MDSYLIPAQEAVSEFTEKRSRFIGRVWRVESEAQARACLEETKKLEYDARHNCWCYILQDGVVRYSDDGEPQGTAGQPMLNVFQREGVRSVCCVVTRYFGGILLGAGGLTRAYSKAARDALEVAGVCEMTLWSRWSVPCTYPLLERLKLEISAAGGLLEDAQYGAEVVLTATFPGGGEGGFLARLTELSAGSLTAEKLDEAFRPGPRMDLK